MFGCAPPLVDSWRESLLNTRITKDLRFLRRLSRNSRADFGVGRASRPIRPACRRHGKGLGDLKRGPSVTRRHRGSGQRPDPRLIDLRSTLFGGFRELPASARLTALRAGLRFS